MERDMNLEWNDKREEQLSSSSSDDENDVWDPRVLKEKMKSKLDLGGNGDRRDDQPLGGGGGFWRGRGRGRGKPLSVQPINYNIQVRDEDEDGSDGGSPYSEGSIHPRDKGEKVSLESSVIGVRGRGWALPLDGTSFRAASPPAERKKSPPSPPIPITKIFWNGGKTKSPVKPKKANGSKQAAKDEDEVDNLDKWLDKDPFEDMPQGIKNTMLGKSRKDRFNPDLNRNGNRGQGAGGITKSGENDSMFSSRKSKGPATGYSNKEIIKNPRFQHAVKQPSVQASWDRPITERKQKKVMSDIDFFTSLKQAGPLGDSCQHLVIHTTCHCDPTRVFGVCAYCYLIFCEEPCLVNGISEGKGKIGMASQEIFSEKFGISKPSNK